MKDRCTNMNHGRNNAPVKHCPSCGDTVNAKAQASRCDSARHAEHLKNRHNYCVDCGKKLR